MRILITGGAGFIGSHIADALIAERHEISIFDDLSTGRRENVPAGAELIVADLRDADAVERSVAERKPEVIVHQAAQTSVSASTREPIRDASINVIGSLHLLESARRHGVGRFVFASTGGAIYGEVPEGAATTEWPPRPRSPYACSKLAFESYLQAYRAEHRLESTILRYANVYGPRQDPHGEAGVCAIFAQRLIAGQPLQINAMRETGDEGCVRDYVFVADVARATLAAVRGELRAPVLNVGTGRPTTTLELAREMGRAMGRSPELTFAPRRPGDLERSVLELHAELAGLRPLIGLEAGVARTVAHFAALVAR